MNFEEYEEGAKSTLNVSRKPITNGLLIYLALGLNGEAGEVAEKIKKAVRDEDGILSDEKKDLLKLELGDVLWYVTMLSKEIGSSLQEIASLNNKKLLSRQERGKISGEGDGR